MAREDLIQAIAKEMDRIWGEEGFGGSDEEYDWLLETYGVSEEEDLVWTEVFEDHLGELDLDDPDARYSEDEKAEIQLFLEDDPAVCRFLEQLLQKYQSKSVSYVW
jgi:hypothetical protein